MELALGKLNESSEISDKKKRKATKSDSSIRFASKKTRLYSTSATSSCDQNDELSTSANIFYPLSVPIIVVEPELNDVIAVENDERKKQRRRRDCRGNWQLVKSALLCYQQHFGNFSIPSQFEIPSNSSDWPESVWGLKLGTVVRDIRTKGSFKDYREELEEMNFDYQTPSEREFGITKTALTAYLHLMGDLEVPTTFKIPENDPSWPQITWGLKLGQRAKHIRHTRLFKAHRDELIKMGFPFTMSKAYGWHRINLAFIRYKEIYGHLLIPFTFAVPLKSDDWPKNTWGMKLGHQVDSIRRRKQYKKHHPELEAMGFVFQVRRKRRPNGSKLRDNVEVV